MTSRALCTCPLCICCKGEIRWRPPSGIGGSGGALHLSLHLLAQSAIKQSAQCDNVGIACIGRDI